MAEEEYKGIGKQDYNCAYAYWDDDDYNDDGSPHISGPYCGCEREKMRYEAVGAAACGGVDDCMYWSLRRDHAILEPTKEQMEKYEGKLDAEEVEEEAERRAEEVICGYQIALHPREEDEMEDFVRNLRILHSGELVEIHSKEKLMCPMRDAPCNARTCAAFHVENYKGHHARCCVPGSSTGTDLGDVVEVME